MATSIQAMDTNVRDIRSRLEDVIKLQVTAGDLDTVHFELGRIVDRLDALEHAD